MDGELTLDMMDARTPPTWSVGKTTRAFAQVEPRHVAELLEAASAAEFFTRPEPVINVRATAFVWRVAITHAGRSRELIIPDRSAHPDLNRLTRAARACVRDRQVLTPATLSDKDRRAMTAALRAPTRGRS